MHALSLAYLWKCKCSTKCRCKYLALLWKHRTGYPNFMLPSLLLIPWWLEGSKQYQSNPPTLRVLLHHFVHLFWLWRFAFELWSKIVCAMLAWSILKATSVASCWQTLWSSLIDRLNCFLGFVNATHFASLSHLLHSHRPVTSNHFMYTKVCSPRRSARWFPDTFLQNRLHFISNVLKSS